MKTHYKLTIYSGLSDKFKEEYVFTQEEISIDPIHFVAVEKKIGDQKKSISSRHSRLIKQTKEKQKTVVL